MIQVFIAMEEIWKIICKKYYEFTLGFMRQLVEKLSKVKAIATYGSGVTKEAKGS